MMNRTELDKLKEELGPRRSLCLSYMDGCDGVSVVPKMSQRAWMKYRGVGKNMVEILDRYGLVSTPDEAGTPGGVFRIPGAPKRVGDWLHRSIKNLRRQRREIRDAAAEGLLLSVADCARLGYFRTAAGYYRIPAAHLEEEDVVWLLSLLGITMDDFETPPGDYACIPVED